MHLGITTVHKGLKALNTGQKWYDKQNVTLEVVSYKIYETSKVRKTAKIRNQYNQVPHLIKDTTHGKVTKSQ